MPRAFISHSTADDGYVAEMESFLRAAGYDDVFNDVSSIRPDEIFWPKIQDGITKSDAVIVVITAASNGSDWVKREVEFARSLSKTIIPVWVEDCPIPPTFANRDVVDFRPRTRQERRYDISRVLRYAPVELIGRENETKLLNEAWQKTLRLEKPRPQVLTFVALGGEGKTSLVAKWAVDQMNAKGWPGCDAAFAWSFYSQGTSEQQAASSDLFLKEALNFFASGTEKEIKEIQEFAASPAGAFEKGQRLARIIGQRRSLLILDGLEPLQYPPTSTAFEAGKLKDEGIAKLLKDLAANSRGLCLVTTRYSLPDLRAYWQTTAPEKKLLRLSKEAGVHLLKILGAKGTAKEYESLVEDVKGHALTLQIMGGFLKRAFAGDIRQRDKVKFEKADEKIDGGHAFRAMAEYEKWLENGSDEAKRELAILRLMGLFDRLATAGCLQALLAAPAIIGLTEPLVNVAQDDWQFSLDALDTANLLTIGRDASNTLISLDTHPHIREFFSKQLHGQQPDAWREAHGRLYEYLCATAPECTKYDQRDAMMEELGIPSDKPQPTLEDLQPLYQAVAHGCQAELQDDAIEKVYWNRICRMREAYSTHRLGAFGSDLGAIACFFNRPWLELLPRISEAKQAWLLNTTGYCLQAVGRVSEALEPMRTAMEWEARQERWHNAAQAATNLSELERTLGQVADAVEDAEHSVTYADSSTDVFRRIVTRATHADALHQAGRRPDAESRFRQAEQMQRERPDRPDYPLLYSLQGFQYCDLLLGAPECTAWQTTCSGGLRPPEESIAHSTTLRAVSQRAMQTLKYYESGNWASLLTIALDHLTLARAVLYETILTQSEIGNRKLEIELAVSGLRRAGQQQYLPPGLLTRVWLRFLTNTRTGPESAQADLDEAWEIAERGSMRLFMADIHLYRARLFFREHQYPWNKNPDGTPRGPADDLAAAEKLINDCGYHRRDEELADAKRAILGM